MEGILYAGISVVGDNTNNGYQTNAFIEGILFPGVRVVGDNTNNGENSGRAKELQTTNYKL